jgi:chaperonin cofactor prefoldin
VCVCVCVLLVSEPAHAAELKELREANEDLELLAKTQDDQKMKLKEEIKQLKREKAAYMRERPERYLALKNSCRTLCCTIM